MPRRSPFQIPDPIGEQALDDLSFRRLLRRPTLAMIVALGLPLALMLGMVLHLLKTAEWVSHTDSVIVQAQRLQTQLVTMQTSFRGYRLANEITYLNPYLKAKSEIYSELDLLEKAVVDNANQVAATKRMRSHLDVWITFAESELAKIRNGETEIHNPAFLKIGAPLFDSVMTELTKFIAAERSLWARRDGDVAHLANLLLGTLAVVAVVGIPAFAFWLRGILKKMSSSHHASLMAAQLRASELRVTLRSIGDAVVATDDKGRVDFLNPAAEELMGWTTAEARGKDLAEVFPIYNEYTGAKTENPVDRVLRENIVVGLANHTVLRSRSGREIPIEDSAAPIRNDAGEVLGVILVFHDVSEKRDGERLLEVSERRLRFLNELGIATRTLVGPAAILDVTTRMLGEHLKVSRCAYADVDDDGNQFTIQHDFTHEVPTTVGTYKLDLFGARAAEKMRTGRTLIVRDLDAEVLPDEGGLTFDAMGVKAIVCCPLLKGGVLRAMMAVHQAMPRDWKESEISLVEEVVSRCWAVIEQARAETDLRASDTLKSAIINTALDGFLTMDHEGVILDWNSAAERIFGRKREEVIGNMLSDMIMPERFREAHRAGLARFVASRKATIMGQRLELPALRADGTEIITETSFNHIPNTEPPLFAGYIRDISERKKAEAELEAARLQAEDDARKIAESVERFRLLVNMVSMQVWTAGVDGGLDYANRQCLRYFGAESDETILGSGWAQFVFPDDLAPAAQKWQHSIATGERYQTEFRLRGGQGDYRWFLARAEAMRDAEGHIVKWFGTNTDIHELKTAQAELERASRAKDDFLAVLSHELRTPLTPVLMTAAALREDERLPKDARDQLGIIERNISLEARLIDDLLDLNGIARGKLSLQPQLCDAHSLIALATEIVLDEALAKEITLASEYKAQRTGLMADPTRFQQVIWNLLRNAVKFTPRGGRISIRTADLGESIRIEIVDSGIGITPEALKRIFTPFDQGDLSGDHRFGGMGLGLAIARAIVEMHGGSITAHSEGTNQGSSFTVDIPGTLPPPIGVAAQTTSASGEAGTIPSVNDVRLFKLLLVEDHEPTIQVLSRLLRRAGHEVVTASTVADALAMAANQKFDMVISDLGLPDGTGISLMRQLRETQTIPGIALSGYGMEEDIARSRDVGFTLHLIKPVVIGQLLRAIQHVGRMCRGTPPP